jgi:hypothetical protein
MDSEVSSYLLPTTKTEIMKNQEAYTNAKKKVETRMSFYTHLAVYLVVISFLTILNLTVTGGYFWAMWPMIGWGSGLIVHGLFTFVFDAESSLKERLIEKELQKGNV